MLSFDALGSVLVLGGGGFLGHHIVQRLLEADDVSQVTVLDLDTDSYSVESARYIKGSITSYDNVTKALEEAKPQVIFHTVSPQALGSPKLFNEVNVEGTRSALKKAGSSKHWYTLRAPPSSTTIAAIWQVRPRNCLAFLCLSRQNYTRTLKPSLRN